jgi:ABC-type multidrug transport system ATPase subunit
MISAFGFVETTVGPTGLLYTTTDDHIVVLNNQTGNFSVHKPFIPMKNMNFVRSFMVGSFAHVLIGSTSSSAVMLVTFDMDLKMELKYVYNWTEYSIEDADYVWAGEYQQDNLPIEDAPYLMTMLWRHKLTQQYVLKFSYFVSRFGVFLPDYMTWTVASAASTGPLQVELNEYYYQDPQTVYSFPNARILLMVANGTMVHIFAVDPEEPEDHSLPFGDVTSPSFFYYSNSTIKHASIYSETSYRTLQSGFAAPSSAVWVLTHEKNDEVEYLNGMLMMQFVAANSNWTTTNPAAQYPPNQCIFGWYTDPGTGQCVNTSIFTLPLNASAYDPEHVYFRNVPSFGTFYGGVESTTTPYKAIFVVKDRTVYIYAVSAETDSFSFGLDYMSNHTFMAKPSIVGLTYNGAYMFIGMEKPLWELLSAIRYYHTCEDLKNITWKERELYNSADASFHTLDKNCNDSNYRMPSLVDFVQYLGICPGVMFCPSFFTNDQPPLIPGQYVVNSYQLMICPEGYYCNQFGPSKCPYGFYCPYNSSAPITCPYTENLNTTCFEEGLSKPKVCPDGMVCVAPYLPPVPSPPGYYIIERNNVSRATFMNCSWGEYCNLARYDGEDRRCPAGAYCADPEVEFPKACSCDAKNFSSCSYCPEGTTFDQPCPAGHYCEGPKNITACYKTQYCPPGTVEAKPCPAGSFCPDPSEKKVCPEGHFCNVGSVEPKKCTIFTYCSEGTGEPSFDFGIVIFTVLALVVLVSAWQVFHHVQNKNRNIREQIRLAALAAKSPESIDSNGGLDSINGAAISKNRIEYLGGMKPFYVDFKFNELGLEIASGKNKLKILEGVTGEIKHGRLTAVMGPSGSGKTTFITTLAGKMYHGNLTGDILINGAPSNIESLRKITGFVPQDDIMLRTLTVKETLSFYANLRLPKEFSSKQKRRTVNRVIDLLGLYDVRHSVVGDENERGISGGQRKRVNIGMELVADPTVLFLDEPTSGLDASTAKEVCESLRRVTEKGMTVIAVIHQPRYEIFQMFHDVMLMGKGGKVVFSGPSESALPYFEELGFHCPAHSNPADFFMDIISGLKPREGHPEFTPDDLPRLWESHKRDYQNGHIENGHANSIIIENDEQEDDQKPLLPQSAPVKEKYLKRRTAGFVSQFGRFAGRSFLQQMRDIKAILVDFFLLFLSGSLLGAVFMNKTYNGPLPDIACEDLKIDVLKDTCTLPLDDPYPQIYGLAALVLALTAAASALKVFGPEKLIFQRENASGASSLAYFLGKDFAQMPVLLLLPLFFTGIIYTLLTPRANFFDLYLGFFLTCYCSFSIGYFVSIIVRPSIAQVASVVAILICMVFSGLRPGLKEFAKMNVVLKFMPNLSFLRWANELLYLRELWEWKDIFKVEKGVEALDYVLTQEQIQWDHIFIVIIAVVFRVFSYLLMLLVDRERK